MKERDVLFVLRPGFSDRGIRWFCPYSAQVMGFLAYYPDVRASVDLREIDFPKPRRPIVELLGDEELAAPLLVLAEGAEPAAVDDVAIRRAGGRAFVEKTMEILRYLAATRGVPAPH